MDGLVYTCNPPTCSNYFSLEVPVMWVSIDPELAWISLMNIQQPDTIWHNVLNYERDPVAQIRVSTVWEPV